MKRVLSRHLLVYGGLSGLVLGSLISAGVLTAAHLQAPAADRPADAGPAPPSPSQAVGFGATLPVAPGPRFADTTWGLVGRIATAQLEEGQAEQSRQAMTLIPEREEAGPPAYRTQLDIAYSDLLRAILQPPRFGPRRPFDPETFRAQLGRAEAVAPRFGGGSARAGAWFQIYEWIKQEQAHDAINVDPLPYLGKAAAEAGKIPAGQAKSESGPEPGPTHLAQAWDRVGGALLLVWPLGLTVLGSLGGEILRKSFEFLGEDVGESAAGWLGPHHQAAPSGGDRQSPPTLSPGKEKGGP